MLFALEPKIEDLSVLDAVGSEIGDFVNCVVFKVQDEK